MGANQPGPASLFQPTISRNCVASFGTLTVAARQTMSASTPKYW